MNEPQKSLLSIIIPVYNEKGSIAMVLNEYKKFRRKYNFELICVNNGSTDGSEEILHDYSRKPQYDFIEVVTVTKNKGYGHGIMSGMKNAKGEVAAWTHADMQTHPSDVFKAFDRYNERGDTKTIVKGHRINRSIP